MARVFPKGSGLFKQDNALCHTTKSIQEWFEEHDIMFKVLTWHVNLNTLEHPWVVLNKQFGSMKAQVLVTI